MAYLILAHDHEAQLDALVARLLPPGSPDFVVIHADARSALWTTLRERDSDPASRVVIVQNPVPVRWGHWSQVHATHKLIETALERGCDAAHLLSGADWSVVRRETMVDAFARPKRDCFIEAIPGLQAERMQTLRFDARWLRVDPEHDRMAYATTWELRRLSRWADRARDAVGLPRSQPFGPWHKGSQWWSLPRDVLCDLAGSVGELLRSGRLRGTVCSDEHVIPTIVARHFAGRVAPNRRFVRFEDGVSSPRILTAADWPDAVASGAWFARKLDMRQDAFFLDAPPVSPKGVSLHRTA